MWKEHLKSTKLLQGGGVSSNIGRDPVSDGFSLFQPLGLLGLTTTLPPPPAPVGIEGNGTSISPFETHGGLAEHEVGISDVCRGVLQLGADRHHVGEKVLEAELCPCPTGECHCFSRWLCKGKQSGVSMQFLQ